MSKIYRVVQMNCVLPRDAGLVSDWDCSTLVDIYHLKEDAVNEARQLVQNHQCEASAVLSVEMVVSVHAEWCIEDRSVSSEYAMPADANSIKSVIAKVKREFTETYEPEHAYMEEM